MPNDLLSLVQFRFTFENYQNFLKKWRISSRISFFGEFSVIPKQSTLTKTGKGPSMCSVKLLRSSITTTSYLRQTTVRNSGTESFTLREAVFYIELLLLRPFYNNNNNNNVKKNDFFSGNRM
jgi:hypothetical protein